MYVRTRIFDMKVFKNNMDVIINTVDKEKLPSYKRLLTEEYWKIPDDQFLAVIEDVIENVKEGKINLVDIIKLIAAINRRIPVYSVLEYSIGTGSVGGKVINHFNQGKKAAEIVLGLLEGIDEEELYSDGEDANEYIFDYNVLKNFEKVVQQWILKH